MSVNWLAFSFPGLKKVHCVFCQRDLAQSGQKPGAGDYAGGNISFNVGDDPAKVLAERKAQAESLAALGMQGLSELKQVHGTMVIFEPEASPLEPSQLPEADAQASSKPGLGLMIKTADCQPIMLAAESGAAVCAIHAGWRGNRADFPALAVDAFCAHYRLSPKQVLAVRGPSLGPAWAEFTNFASEWGEGFRPWFNEATRSMDLWQLTRSQLRKAGLEQGRIYSLDICTAQNWRQFFSYRRSPVPCGRQASLIWIAK